VPSNNNTINGLRHQRHLQKKKQTIGQREVGNHSGEQIGTEKKDTEENRSKNEIEFDLMEDKIDIGVRRRYSSRRRSIRKFF